MILGPDDIFECPECGQRLARQTLMSGNTFGAEIYSDGKMEAPMLPRFPDLVKCGRCSAFFWLHNLQPLDAPPPGREVPFDNPGQHDGPPYADSLSLTELLEALEKKSYDNPKEEFNLRLETWWAFNDRVRNGKPLHQTRAQKKLWQENLGKLQALLDPNDPKQAIMIAEIHRNLGEFEKCLELLNTLTEPTRNPAIEQIKEACERRESRVIQLKG